MVYSDIVAEKRKNAPGQGRKKEGRTASSIAMLSEFWELLDRLRGKNSRGKALEALVLAVGHSLDSTEKGRNPDSSPQSGAAEPLRA